MISISKRIADELSARENQVEAAIALLDEGSTVPFIARYRKEATGGLDDTQLRTLEERLRYLRELEERRTAILSSVAEQGKLTDELKAQLDAADTKTRLEDLYLPYKPKRRTKAMIAREAGLGAAGAGASGKPRRGAGSGGGRLRRSGKGRARRQVGAGRCAPYPGRAVRRGCRAGRPPARLCRRQRPGGFGRGRGEARGRRQVLRLFRLLRAAEADPVAPGARHVPRPDAGRARPQDRGGRSRDRPAAPLRGDHRQPSGHPRCRPGGGQVAAGDGALGLEDQDRPACRAGSAGRTARPRRGRGDPRLRPQPA